MAMPRAVVVLLLVAVPGLAQGVQPSQAAVLDGGNPGNRVGPRRRRRGPGWPLRRMARAVMTDIHGTIMPMAANASSMRKYRWLEGPVPEEDVTPMVTSPEEEFEHIGNEFSGILATLRQMHEDAKALEQMNVDLDVWRSHTTDLLEEVGKLKRLFECYGDADGIDTLEDASTHLGLREVAEDTQKRGHAFNELLTEAGRLTGKYAKMKKVLRGQGFLKEVMANLHALENKAKMTREAGADQLAETGWATEIRDMAQRAKTFVASQEAIGIGYNSYNITIKALAAIEKNAMKVRPVAEPTEARPSTLAAATLPAKATTWPWTSPDKQDEAMMNWYAELADWSVQKQKEAIWDEYDNEVALANNKVDLVLNSCSDSLTALKKEIIVCPTA